jgi:hypothetical protein
MAQSSAGGAAPLLAYQELLGLPSAPAAAGATATESGAPLAASQRKLLGLLLAKGAALQRCGHLGCEATVPADVGLCARHLRQHALRPKLDLGQ